jgi:uncharacterized protein
VAVGANGDSGVLEIAVFARAPSLGRVKRRLAAAVGEAEALRVYERLLARAIGAAIGACERRADLVPVLWHHGDWPASFPLPPALAARMRRQPSDDMLDNLREALRLDAAPGRRGAVVFGADHPEIEAAHLLEIAALLDGRDVAIGPAEDGGFWAIGAVVELGDALRDLPLGTGDAFLSLARGVRGAGHSCGLGPTLRDVDTAADLEAWRAEMHRG